MAVAVFAGACAKTDDSTHPLTGLEQSIRPAPKPYSHTGALKQRNGQVGDSTPGEGKFKGAEDEGSGQFLSGRAFSDTVRAERTVRGGEGITLNLVNVPIAQAAKSVLGEILAVNYTVADKLAGNITIQTSTPMSREALVDVFESALKVNGAALVRTEGHYRIVPAQGAQAGARLTNGARRDASAGLQIQVLTLAFVAPSEMRRILEPVATPGSILSVDDNRNLLVVAGTQRELADIAQLVALFDVDWMKGMSVGIYPVSASDPEALARELETVMGLDKDGPLKGSLRIVPNRRLSSIMVIATRPVHLEAARKWVHNLDKAASRTEDQLFVYKVKNRVASELAVVLTRMLAGKDAGGQQQGAGIGPRLDPVVTSSGPTAEPVAPARTSGLTGGIATPAASPAAPGNPGGPGNLLLTPPPPPPSAPPALPISTASAADGSSLFQGRTAKIVADEANNSLLITSTRKDYERITQILSRLDVMPTQVMLEALIAEVTLNDDLKFGVKWSKLSERYNATLSDRDDGSIASNFPGFSYFFQSRSFAGVIDTLQRITKVKVMSAPSLMVLDNRKATLQVGDQVPILTQSAANPLIGNGTQINSISQRDTGIILNVAPRVSDSGRVTLDIEQEVSNVTETTSSNIGSPSFQQRKLKTTVVVNDGEVIALGGLIQERDTITKSQIPILGNIPILGAAFRQKSDKIDRTELMVFLRPTVVRDAAEARDVTEEFRHRLNIGKPTTQKGRDINDRDARRIFR
jgi:general secretion pathway protein D